MKNTIKTDKSSIIEQLRSPPKLITAYITRIQVWHKSHIHDTVSEH